MRDARLAIVRRGAAEFFFCHIFMRHSLDHVRTGDEHIGRVLDHDVEVGNRRTVNGAAGAWAHDATDLRHDPAGQSVAQKNVSVTAETDDAFLYARTAGIV